MNLYIEINQSYWYLLELWDYHDFDAKTELNDFVTEASATIVKLSFHTVMKGINVVAVEKQTSEDCDKSK